MITTDLVLADCCFNFADALAAMCLVHMSPDEDESHLVWRDTSIPAHGQALKELLIRGYADRHDARCYTVRRDVIAAQRHALRAETPATAPS